MNDRNKTNQPVVIKGLRNEWCLQNERDLLKRFKGQGPIRPLIDEIEGFAGVPPLVLKYYDESLYHASNAKKLTSLEVKFVAKRVLQALELLHSNDYIFTGMCTQNICHLLIHSTDNADITDLKPHNILADLGQGANRFSYVVLADLGDTCLADSEYAKSGQRIRGSYFSQS